MKKYKCTACGKYVSETQLEICEPCKKYLEIGKMVEWAVNEKIPFVRLSGCTVIINKGDLEILKFAHDKYFKEVKK